MEVTFKLLGYNKAVKQNWQQEEAVGREIR
jgi:hypothetical protein